VALGLTPRDWALMAVLLVVGLGIAAVMAALARLVGL
jgi:predicted metal-binding membrane protein